MSLNTLINDSHKAWLIPRVHAQKFDNFTVDGMTGINGATGELLYNSDYSQFMYYNGTNWLNFSGTTGLIKSVENAKCHLNTNQSGNTGVQFQIGTADNFNQGLEYKTSSISTDFAGNLTFIQGGKFSISLVANFTLGTVVSPPGSIAFYVVKNGLTTLAEANLQRSSGSTDYVNLTTDVIIDPGDVIGFYCNSVDTNITILANITQIFASSLT